MGRKPTARHSIERENTNGNYEPDNCKWATAAEQAHNTRSNKLTAETVVEIRRRRGMGETTVALGAAFGVHSSHVSRLCRGLAWADV